ncbi:DEAD-box ATP-dependent RNA helicase 5 [Silene latifolia]|uniref:DEAD-box ATP-dependent RNA helicase 5 n=1 Tax=Silene latifolia TaxID=37657 RepID=UPI003D76E2DC
MAGKFKDDEDRDHKRKRKLQQPEDEAEEVIVATTKEEKKKKKNKKNKNNEETENQQNGQLGIEKVSNGLESDDKKRDDLASGSENGGEMESSKEKKKSKKKKGEKFVNGGNDDADVVVGVETVEEQKKSYGGVIVSGKDSSNSKYSPLTSFNEAKVPKEVMQCCKGFDKPSPIQAHAWPFLLDGRDFIGIAQTGSGKTLAFGIPAMMHVLGKRKADKSRRVNPLCLMLSPTRELAQQIADVLVDAGQSCGVKSTCFYGGTSKGPQLAALRSGVDIVIATPGRLKDLIEMGKCNLKEASFVVLDEADRMLDMGFEQDVRSILSQTCSARQMVMFSATWPTAVHQLAQEFMDPNPVKVVVGSEDLAANHDVMQIVEVLEEYKRDQRLVTLLDKYHPSQRNRVLVFVLYQKEADRVERFLQGRGLNVVGIHALVNKRRRTKSLALFKSGTCNLMVATDVAARGLDIPDVEVVINYSFPLTTEDYVHRIGRTGRAGKKGVAHTFFTKENKGLAGELVNVLREAGQEIPHDLVKFGTHVKKKESKLYGAHFKEITADAPKSTKITFGDSDDE